MNVWNKDDDRYVHVTCSPLKISRPLCVNRRVPTDLDFGVKHKIPLYLLSFKTSHWVTAKRNKKDFTSPKPCTKATLANIFTWSTKPDRREYFVTSMSKCANAIKTLPDWETTRQYSLMQQRDGNDGKALSLQAWSGPEGSRKFRFPDFMTTAQDGDKVVSLKHQAPLPPRNTPGTHFC